MGKYIFLVFFALYNSVAYSQLTVQGKIYDEVTKAQVSYAKVRIHHTNTGALTNEDGFFEIHCNENDTLVISHSLYQDIHIHSSYFVNNKILFLQHHFQDIEEVQVIGSKNGLLDLFLKSRTALSKNEAFDSKAYFSLESSTDNTPIELIEAYYNSHIDFNGIQQLQLKNGRIGMSSDDNSYFVSLSTTRILSNYNLFRSKNNLLPSNPLQLSRRKLKKYYKIDFVSIENGLHKLHFIPIDSKKTNDLFETYVWLNKKEHRITRLEFVKMDMEKLPFIELNRTDTIDSLNFYLTYNFTNNSSHQNLQNIEFKYDLLYMNQRSNKRINSSGAFLFYASNQLFNLPFYDYNKFLISDYDKIISQPFNSFFWNNNELLRTSNKRKAYTDYFKSNGVLLNYNGLQQINPVFKNKLIHWSEKRILLLQINGQKNYAVNAATLYDYHNLTPLSELYNLESFIYLDRNKFGDSVNYELKTIINLEESFYHLEKNKNTLCFINLYFDIAEVEKRQLKGVLEERDWTVKQLDSLYQSANAQLTEHLKIFLKETERGKNDAAMEKYVKYIQDKLLIDNSLLIDLEELTVSVDGKSAKERDVFAESYDYGSALIKIGKYSEALSVLLDIEALGDKHPWLYYNIGVCYLKLGENENSCYYFSKSEEFGDTLEELIKETCMDFNRTD